MSYLKLTGGARSSALIKAIIVTILLAIFFVFSLPAFAVPYNWDGGHDMPGWTGPAGTMYFAEGTTRNGFEEYLILRNPGLATSSVTVTYSFPPPEEPKVQPLVLEAGSGASICVNDVTGPGKDVSIAITAEPGIIAERQMYFNYKGVWTGGHVTCGVAATSKTWYFAEGTTRQGFAEWLCLQNPSDESTKVTLTYVLGAGENRKVNDVIEAKSRKTVGVNAAVGADQDVSVIVEAEKPVVAERPMYFDYKNAWRGGHNITGSTELSREWYFAEGTTRTGFEEWLCIMNPGPDTTARVEYLFHDSAPLVRDYALKANARTTIFVNQEVGPEKDVSVKVTGMDMILCERPMYFLYHGAYEGGHIVLGSSVGAQTWQFPTAAVGPGFESYLCLMNATSEQAHVKVEVIGDGDGYHNDDLFLNPQTRFTVDLNAASAGIAMPWVKVTAGSDVIVERPTYFSYEPKVAPEPFTFAMWNGIELKSPIKYSDYLGGIFHEASAEGSDGLTNNVQVLQPFGVCMRDDNSPRLYPGVSHETGGDPVFFIESSRGRGTYSTTACDVQSKAGAQVYTPVTGTVLAAESYMLYGSYPDLRVKILIDGYPGYQMAVLHMSSLAVAAGQRVEAGKTVIGTVRDLVPYFHSGPNDYTREEGNHSHVQINYRPDEHPNRIY